MRPKRQFTLDENLKGIGPFGRVAGHLNRLNRILNRTRFVSGGDVTLTKDGLIMRLPKDWPITCFMPMMVDDNTLRIASGYLVVNGRGMWRVPTDTAVYYSDVTVTSSGWALLRASRSDPSDVAIAFQASAPNPQSATYFEFPLCKMTKTGDVVSFAEPPHVGNVSITGL